MSPTAVRPAGQPKAAPLPAALVDALGRALGARRVLVLPAGASPPPAERGLLRRNDVHVLSVEIPGSARHIVWELPEPPTASDKLVAAALVRSLDTGRPAPPACAEVLTALALPESERPAAVVAAVVRAVGAKAAAVALTDGTVVAEGPGRPVLHHAALEAARGPDGRVDILGRTFLTRRLTFNGEPCGGLALEGMTDPTALAGCLAALAAAVRREPPAPTSPQPVDSVPALVAALPVTAVVVDRDGALVAASPKAEEVFALTDFDLGAAMDGRLGSLDVADLARTGLVPPAVVAGERCLEPSATTLPDGSRLVMFDDASASDESRQTHEELISAMSHELRTPVAAIKTLLEVVKHPRSREKPERVTSLLEAGGAEVHRLERLVEDLLLATRVATGGLNARCDDIALRPIIDDVVRLVGRRHADCRFEVRGDGTAYADPGLVRHAVWHLCDNAAKFSEPGGVVTVDCNGTEVHVIDRGAGIFSGDLPDLFVPFRRCDRNATAQHGGAGIGLHLVKSAVTAQGGEVFVQSRLGKGSTFGFRLRPPAG